MSKPPRKMTVKKKKDIHLVEIGGTYKVTIKCMDEDTAVLLWRLLKKPDVGVGVFDDVQFDIEPSLTSISEKRDEWNSLSSEEKRRFDYEYSAFLNGEPVREEA